MKQTLPTAERARQLFAYDPATGIITRKVALSNSVKVGEIIVNDNGDGYARVHVDGARVYVHRLAWLLHYGQWPSGQVDHVDGNPANNATSNLRDVSHTINAQNVRKPKGRSTGYLGVRWDDERKKYQASISVGPRGKAKSIYLGRFDNPEMAHAAYVNAKRSLHPGCTL